jgi:hypothetical protein
VTDQFSTVSRQPRGENPLREATRPRLPRRTHRSGLLPGSYPGHGTGLYFVGLEDNDAIYAYALNQSTSGYTRVATIASGFPAVMDLEFEPETGHHWAVCDDTCQGQTTTLDLNPQGKFAATATYNRPSGMSNLNNEGFAIAPQSTCSAGHRPSSGPTTATPATTPSTQAPCPAQGTGTLPCTS